MADIEKDPHRIDLPGGGWAELRFRGELPLRTTRRLYALWQHQLVHDMGFRKEQGYDPASDDPYEWLKTVEIQENPESDTPWQIYARELVFEFLVAWEYPAGRETVTTLPTPETVLDLPEGPWLAVLREASQRFLNTLRPDFTPDGVGDPKADTSSSDDSPPPGKDPSSKDTSQASESSTSTPSGGSDTPNEAD